MAERISFLDTSTFNKLRDPVKLFTVQKMVGSGTYGSVYKAIHKQSGTEVAIKVMNVSSKMIEDNKKELEVLRKYSSNQNICRFFGAFMVRDSSGKVPNRLWVVMEYCGGGSANEVSRTFMIEGKTMKESWCIYFLKGILKGLAYLHKNDVIHRDIKSQNVMLNKNGVVKLVDFGVSTMLSHDRPYSNGFIGTPYWMAPEVILCKNDPHAYYDCRCDIWSTGITAIELLQGMPPKAEMDPMVALKSIPVSKPPTLKPRLFKSSDYANFVKSCLIMDYKLRPSANELLTNPIFLMSVSRESGIISKLVKAITGLKVDKSKQIENIRISQKMDDQTAKKIAEESGIFVESKISKTLSKTRDVPPVSERTNLLKKQGSTMKEQPNQLCSSDSDQSGEIVTKESETENPEELLKTIECINQTSKPKNENIQSNSQRPPPQKMDKIIQAKQKNKTEPIDYFKKDNNDDDERERIKLVSVSISGAVKKSPNRECVDIPIDDKPPNDNNGKVPIGEIVQKNIAIEESFEEYAKKEYHLDNTKSFRILNKLNMLSFYQKNKKNINDPKEDGLNGDKAVLESAKNQRQYSIIKSIENPVIQNKNSISEQDIKGDENSKEPTSFENQESYNRVLPSMNVGNSSMQSERLTQISEMKTYTYPSDMKILCGCVYKDRVILLGIEDGILAFDQGRELKYTFVRLDESVKYLRFGCFTNILYFIKENGKKLEAVNLMLPEAATSINFENIKLDKNLLDDDLIDCLNFSDEYLSNENIIIAVALPNSIRIYSKELSNVEDYDLIMTVCTSITEDINKLLIYIKDEVCSIVIQTINEIYAGPMDRIEFENILQMKTPFNYLSCIIYKDILYCYTDIGAATYRFDSNTSKVIRVSMKTLPYKTKFLTEKGKILGIVGEIICFDSIENSLFNQLIRHSSCSKDESPIKSNAPISKVICELSNIIYTIGSSQNELHAIILK